MRIMHHVFIEADDKTRREFDRLGLKVEFFDGRGTVRNHFVLDIAESDPTWTDVQKWISKRTHFESISPSFSQVEVAAARWLEVLPDWHHGYPQPDDDFGYRDLTYDLSDYCSTCGIGAVQKAPFRMRREPRWGRRGILQLNWVFDEFFVTPEVWATVFEPHGIASRPVVKRGGAELQTVVQLDVVEQVRIRTKGLDAETCPACGRLKYLPIRRGPLPEFVDEPSGHMARTSEFFGSGASAHHAIVLSQALWAAIRAAKVRGASAHPVAPLETPIT
jgi:rRNA maturation protein Nop10